LRFKILDSMEDTDVIVDNKRTTNIGMVPVVTSFDTDSINKRRDTLVQNARCTLTFKRHEHF